MPLLQPLVFLVGLALVVRTILGAIRSFVLPRGADDWLTRIAFRASQGLFQLAASPRQPYQRRDRIMAYYGPVTLVLLPAWWLLLVWLGYAAMFWAVDARAPLDALRESGSSLLTLGFVAPDTSRAAGLVFSEALIGLVLVALLIAYLPTIYAAFSRRELQVSLLEVRADSPPSPLVLLTRIDRLGGLGALHDMWEAWERWFAELEESHTSLPVLVTYRSQQADHSWVNAAGAILDAAALTRAAVDIPGDVQADLTIRAGYLALRRIADYFKVAYDPAPHPDAPISISRAKFDKALKVLEAAGVPLHADREQAWRDFKGWRVNYDTVLRALERITLAPTPWWERPMHSAYLTDEPDQAVVAARTLPEAVEASAAAETAAATEP